MPDSRTTSAIRTHQHTAHRLPDGWITVGRHHRGWAVTVLRDTGTRTGVQDGRTVHPGRTAAEQHAHALAAHAHAAAAVAA